MATESESLVGLWVDREGRVHRAWRTAQGGIREEASPFEFYAWGPSEAKVPDAKKVELAGDGPFPRRWHFPSLESYREALKDRSLGLDAIRPLEHQWLLATESRLYAELPFTALHRVQLDIEVSTGEVGTFPDATRPGDRVLAIGLRSSLNGESRILEIAEETDAAERVLLKEFGEVLCELDPDVIEGHNLYNFDLDFLAKRCRRYRVKKIWGRFGGEATTRKSRLRVAERWIDFLRFDLPGRAIFDTYLAVQLYDVSTRDMPNYTLKESAIYFGVTTEEDDRTYLPGDQIEHIFRQDRARFRAYLEDDLRETAGLAERLLPTYVAQAQSFPTLLQEACLRGTGSKVDLLLLERYFHANHALPGGSEVSMFAGGFTKSYGEGVFEKVLHFDVASLYPSLLLQIGRNPANDSLGAFIPLLESLRRYRLDFKQRAREATDPIERQEFSARQASFKILINSFYGYLGFAGARFADGELAAEVTQRGRDLLQQLIAWFEGEGMQVLEADTDGIYVSSPDYYDDPEALLARVKETLPDGIDLEFDGKYPRMFCYKAKNYALYDGERVTIRGSALRSRGIEPFLKELTYHLIHYLLGVEEFSPEVLLNRMADEIESGEMEVKRLAKSEFLSMSPSAYAEKIEKGGKPRRAALEVALQLDPPPRMGERVRFYAGPKEKGKSAEWQRAVPLDHFDPITRPYDPKYYLLKLRDWAKRYGAFYA
jgi:DNA polymerase elongation subunit (family B)